MSVRSEWRVGASVCRSTSAVSDRSAPAAGQLTKSTLLHQSNPISPSLPQFLYNDALHSIYKYLTLSELQSAVCSCRRWRDAAYQFTRSVHIPYVTDVDHLNEIIRSPLGHVSSINCEYSVCDSSLKLFHQLPHLHSLTAHSLAISPNIACEEYADDQPDHFLPATLQYIKVSTRGLTRAGSRP